MGESSRILRARVDTQALRHNLGVIRQTAPQARVMAVIKANAYGHGLVQSAIALSAADAFAVARVEEAVELRAAGIGHPIVLLEGLLSAAQQTLAATLRLDLVVHDRTQIAMLEAAPPTQPLTAWIKVNTGMNRLGFAVAELPEVWRRLQALRPALASVNLMTHLAAADEPAASLTATQLQRFEQARAALPAVHLTSIGNSAGIFCGAASQGDWIRPGIALYGISPFAQRSAAELGLRPAMRLETGVIALHDVPAGEAVGYGATWCAPRPSRIAVLAAGYADGLPRHLPAGTLVLVDGQPAPMVGRVSMDMTMVDVTDLRDARVGSVVLLWGPGLPAEQMAASAGTIAYELVTRLGRRVPLEYI